jgi:GNAT superfamily N-acetyltransferase
MTIRLGTEADIEPLVAMGARFHRDSPYAAIVDCNPDRMRELGVWLLTHGAILVAEQDERQVGMLGIAIVPHLVSGQPCAGECFWWVDPDARGSAGVRLVRAAEKWAKEQGAEFLELGAPGPRVERLCEALGYRPIERSFQRAL